MRSTSSTVRAGDIEVACTVVGDGPPVIALHGAVGLGSSYMRSLDPWGDDVRLVYFSATGVPLRARVQVTLRQYEQSDAFGPQNPTSGTPRPHAVHRVSRGETLDRIAARHYADPTAWRLIAEANDIDDPLSLRPGMLIAIPGRTA